MKKRVFNINIIKNYMKVNNLTKKQFCNVCNINMIDFYRIMADDTKVSSIPVAKIAKLLHCKLDDLINYKNYEYNKRFK